MLFDEYKQEEAGVETMHPEFVPVAFAGSMERAEYLRSILERHNIPALIDDDSDPESIYTSLGRGVPVQVPEQMHDRASMIVAEEEGGAGLLEAAANDDSDEEDEDYFDDDEDEDLDDDDLDDLDDLDDDYDEEEDEDEDDFDEDLDDDYD